MQTTPVAGLMNENSEQYYKGKERQLYAKKQQQIIDFWTLRNTHTADTNDGAAAEVWGDYLRFSWLG